MEQNVALEMFGYLKEHFVGLAKDKGDEVIEGSEFIRVTRSKTNNVWDCEKEVKQLLDKTGGNNVKVNCPTDCVIINYSSKVQSLYVGLFTAREMSYTYSGIEKSYFEMLATNERRVKGYSYSKDGVLYAHSTLRRKVSRSKSKIPEYNPPFSMNFVSKGTKHWPCTMKDLFSVRAMGSSLFDDFIRAMMLYWGKSNSIWNDLEKDYAGMSAYGAIPLSIIKESHTRKELIAKYYGEDKAFNRNNREPIGYGIFLARAARVVKPEELQKLFGYNPGFVFIGRAKNDLVEPLVRFIGNSIPEEDNKRYSSIDANIKDAILMSFKKRKLIPVSFKSVNGFVKWHDELALTYIYSAAEKMQIKEDSKFDQLKLPEDCVKLTTTRQMVEEGIFQHNCVASYIDRVNNDYCSIWSQRKADGTRNTIEIQMKNKKYCIVQMCAFANQRPLEEDYKKVKCAVDECNKAKKRELLPPTVS